MTPQDIILRNLGSMNDATQRYPRPLPAELARWYCYPRDSGHSIMSLLRRDYRTGLSMEDAADSMVPAPVKTVLRGYSICDGFVVIDVPCSEELCDAPKTLPRYTAVLGLEVPAEDDEFGTTPPQENVGGYIFTENDGQRLLRTNYFETAHAQRGLACLAVNAAAFRLLVPTPLLSQVAEMKMAEYVIVSDAAEHARLELLFEDHTDSPYRLEIDQGQCDRRPSKADDGRTDLRFLVYGPGCRLLLDRPARYRRVARVPWMQPWK